MKKALILSAALLAGTISYAQRTHTIATKEAKQVGLSATPAAKPTAVGDTLTLSNVAAGDTLTLYSAGTNGGYVTGTNMWGDKAFAERYDFSGKDSSMKIIGFFAQFGGTVSASSTKSVRFKVWNVAAPQMITADMYYSGFPDKAADSLTVPVTQLGIGSTVDTLKKFTFVAPKTVSGSFFIGYSIDYNFSTLAGDTVALASSKDGDRTSPLYTVSYIKNTAGDTVDIDTMVNVQNATLYADNQWHDNYTDNDSLFNNLAIFPIVIIGNPTEVKGVTRNELTFFGVYPNPATNSTNVKFALSQAADVVLQVVDAAGRTVYTNTYADMNTGEHSIPLNTSVLAAGTYYYILRTSENDGVAGVLEVVK